MKGQCHCGNIRVELQLTKPAEAYNPRACDCSYCRGHGVSYISDPQGKLTIRIGSPLMLGFYQQGSGSADFFFCRKCGLLCGVRYQERNNVYAAINRRIIDDNENFAREISVSPQKLAAADKIKRWKEAWFSN